MAWHLNLDTGNHYSRRLPKENGIYQNKFGVKKKGQQVPLGNLVLDLSQLERQDIVAVENRAFYRVHIWFDGSRFYIAKTEDAENKLVLNFEAL